MLTGIGTDVCALARIEAVWQRFGTRFADRLLTPVERLQKAWDAPALARRWAVKEAVAKALGTGIGAAVGFQDIELTYTPAGMLVCTVRGVANHQIWVSVSDDAGVAMAFCVVEKA